MAPPGSMTGGVATGGGCWTTCSRIRSGPASLTVQAQDVARAHVLGQRGGHARAEQRQHSAVEDAGGHDRAGAQRRRRQRGAQQDELRGDLHSSSFIGRRRPHLHGTWPLHRSVRHAGRDGPAGPAGQRSRQCLDARLQGRPRLAALVRRPDAEQQHRRLDRRAARPGRRHRQAGDRPAPAGAARHRPAARPRGRRRRLLRRADQAGRALHAQRLVHGRRQGQPRRPDGQPGPRRRRQADRRSPTAPSTRPRSRSSTSATRSSRATPTSPARPAARRPGTVKSGSLEGSGVDPARAMVDLMASMRSMEATQRAITTIDTSLGQTASQVGGLPG